HRPVDPPEADFSTASIESGREERPTRSTRSTSSEPEASGTSATGIPGPVGTFRQRDPGEDRFRERQGAPAEPEPITRTENGTETSPVEAKSEEQASELQSRFVIVC